MISNFDGDKSTTSNSIIYLSDHLLTLKHNAINDIFLKPNNRKENDLTYFNNWAKNVYFHKEYIKTLGNYTLDAHIE